VIFREVDLVKLDIPRKEGQLFGKTISICHIFSKALPYILDEVLMDTEDLSIFSISIKGSTL